jgi:hypothetical protein
MIKYLLAFGLAFLGVAHAADVTVNFNNPGATPASPTNPLPTASGEYNGAGAGTSQFGLPVGTGTTLTVPKGAICAYITVESGNVRRTSDGTTPTTTVGTPLLAGSQWADCGPLASYQFAATNILSSPTLDVEYFKW